MQNVSILILSFVLIIIATVIVIILLLRLSMSFFIAADNRNMSATAALKRSAFLMIGNKGRYFLLALSFIGWAILVSLPASIGLTSMILSPVTGTSIPTVVVAILTVLTIILNCPLLLYMQTATAVFYSNISGNFSTGSANSSAQSDAYDENEQTIQ